MTRRGVLFIVSPERPGADTAIHLLLIRTLDRSRFDVHVAYPPNSATAALVAAIPQIRSRPTDFGPRTGPRSILDWPLQALHAARAALSLAGLALYARRHGISVVYATDRTRDAAPCVLIAKASGARSIVHVHVAFGAWMKRPTRWALAHADGLVAISAFVARSLTAAGLSPAKVRVVLNAIDLRLWDPTRDRAEARQRLALAEESLVIACVGRIFRGKGQEALVRAMPTVLRQAAQARLLIVGGDDRVANAGGGSHADELKTLVSDLGIGHAVSFIGHVRDIAGVLAACDIFALPSFEEPFGLVYLEAMAMRRPVVALLSGGAPEVVEDGRSGILVPERDDAALAAALSALIRDPALRARLGAEGRVQVETKFTPERLAADAAAVLGD